jgi:hypothetical protein
MKKEKKEETTLVVTEYNPTPPVRNKWGNAIKTISIFKKGKAWVFNDKLVDLKEEPFVAGADTLLDRIAGDNKKVEATFSETKFPGSQLTLEYVSGKVSSGTIYFCKELDHELWLCPALWKYFENSPQTIFLQTK